MHGKRVYCPQSAFAPPACRLPTFPEIPLRLIVVGAMPALTKNPGAGPLLERERKMLKKGPRNFDQAPKIYTNRRDL